VKEGVLRYEYNLFEVSRTKIQASSKLPAGKVRLEVESKLTNKVGGPMEVTLKINGEIVGRGEVPITAAYLFNGNDCLDLGSDFGSPVSLDYFDQAPFPWNGTIGTTKISYPRK